MGDRPELSIVVASVESAHTLDSALRAFRRTCAGLRHEIIVVDASRDHSAAVARGCEGVTVLTRPPDTLVPVLWAEGVRRSSGRYVALTTGHCVVDEPWARALVSALEAGAGAAGAGLLPLPQTGAVDRAVFFLRYGGFLALTRGEGRVVTDVPGDNVAYQGDAVREYVEAREGGFWELEYHELLRARGERIVAVPEATAGFGRSFPFGVILRHRFDHGRHFGASRTGEGGEPRWRVVLPSPLVPLALLLRAAGRARGHRGMLRRLVTAAPAFLALASAWAAGEAVGACFPPRRRSP